MNPRAIAINARLLTWLFAALALLGGMFLGPRAPITIAAVFATLIGIAVTMIARRL